LKFCFPDLVKLGSGILEIDALTGACAFDRRPIKQLSIANELYSWLRDDLKRYQIPLDGLIRARLSAQLRFSKIPWSARTRKEEKFFDKGLLFQTSKMHRCEIDCRSEVATDEAVYRGQYSDVEEWPVGWPRR
jgi:hypothetical protein